MSIINNIFAFCNASKITDIRDSIHTEMDERQRILENIGFTVQRSEHIYEDSLSLIAKRGNVVLKDTRFLRGGKDLSMILKDGDHETTVPLYPYKFEDVIAIVNGAQ